MQAVPHCVVIGQSAPAIANGSRIRIRAGHNPCILQRLSHQAAASPVESSRVKIPKESSEVFSRYNNLQKSQGYDLTQFAGKNVMRYVYKITNYPGATEPVYATLLVYKNQVIGGDITDTAAKGKIQGLKSPTPGQTAPTGESTEP